MPQTWQSPRPIREILVEQFMNDLTRALALYDKACTQGSNAACKAATRLRGTQ
jgi:hypothetical protein